MSRISNEAIPARFFKPEPLETVRSLAGALALWLVPGAALGVLVQFDGIPLALRVILSSAFAVLGHEGTHFNLHENRVTSARIGTLASALVPFHMNAGFAVLHGEHHRWTNTDKDPDAVFFAKFKTFASRFWLARVAASRRYQAETWKLALDRHPAGYRFTVGLTRPELVSLARLNLVAAYSALAAYAVFAWYAPLWATGVVFIPLAVTIPLSGLRPYFEHAGTGSGRYSRARTWASPVFDFLYRGVNYHLAHHLYPSVPAIKLGEFHRWLKAHGRIPIEGADPAIEVHRLRDLIGAVGAPLGPLSAATTQTSAMHSTSTSTSLGKRATSIVERAGVSDLKYAP